MKLVMTAAATPAHKIHKGA